VSPLLYCTVLRSWRGWTRQRRQKAAKHRAALAVYERRLLAAALQQWRWVQHSKVRQQLQLCSARTQHQAAVQAITQLAPCWPASRVAAVC
jgi:hypothetical protein